MVLRGAGQASFALTPAYMFIIITVNCSRRQGVEIMATATPGHHIALKTGTNADLEEAKKNLDDMAILIHTFIEVTPQCVQNPTWGHGLSQGLGSY